MTPKKKRNIWNFLFAFIPGVSEMYMGFMKNGISLLCIFILSFVTITTLRLNDVFVLVVFLIWAFGFFHARNIVACSDEEFAALEDKCIWEEFSFGTSLKIKNSTFRKWLAVFLIIIGGGVIWNNLYDLLVFLIPDTLWQFIYPVVNRVPGLIFAVFVIMVGVKLIVGKKKELDENE